MNPILQQKLDELQRQIDSLRRFEGTDFIESAKTRIGAGNINGIEDTEPSVINQSIGGDAPFTSPKDYDRKIKIRFKGDTYYIGVYNI